MQHGKIAEMRMLSMMPYDISCGVVTSEFQMVSGASMTKTNDYNYCYYVSCGSTWQGGVLACTLLGQFLIVAVLCRWMSG